MVARPLILSGPNCRAALMEIVPPAEKPDTVILERSKTDGLLMTQVKTSSMSWTGKGNCIEITSDGKCQSIMKDLRDARVPDDDHNYVSKISF